MLLQARGFDDRWRSWVSSLLHTDKTAILLNSIPSSWLTCAKGLPQGDSLSPYLFIIVVDLLRRMIHKAWDAGELHHPLCDDIPCPVL